MDQLGKSMVIAGLALAAIGGLFWLASLAGLRLGRLPGDLAIQRGSLQIYVPITSMLILSALATLALWLISVWRR